MRIIGVDFHVRQQTIAMFDTETKELVKKTLKREGEQVREFYSALPRPVQVGIEATGSRYWFLDLLEELRIDRQLGHPAAIRAAEPRKQKFDGRDALLLLHLQIENRFSSIWVPSRELRDLHVLLRHRHQWVAYADQGTKRTASHRRESRLTARTVAVEPNRPTRDRVVAVSAACSPSTKRIADLVLHVEHEDRRARRAGEGPSAAAFRGQAVDEPSGSWTCHGVGDGRVFR